MKPRHWFGLVVLFVPVFLLGCRQTSETPADKEYDIKGKVVSIAPDKKAVTLDHEAVPGLMGAMKMEFPVESPNVLEAIAAGDQVEGRLKVTSDNRKVVTRLKKSSPSASGEVGEEEAEIKTARAKLDPGDLKLADAQNVCPISGERLGSMGKPFKLTLKGRPVFLCCKGCTKDAQKEPDKMVEKVKKLKAKNK